MIDIADLLGTPYRLGGRRIGVFLDCLGTSLIALHRWHGVECPPDPWATLQRDWLARTLDAARGLPPCWFSAAEPVKLADGDLVVGWHPQPWAAAIINGHVVTAEPSIGVHCCPLFRWRGGQAQVFRHDSRRCAAGHPGRADDPARRD